MSSLDFFQQAAPPLSVDTVETILARLIADANAGVDPSDPAFLDLVAGAIANDFFVAFAIEVDRVRDFAANEVVRAGIPTLSYGPYLDAWAEALGIGRKAANAATGTATFTGATGSIVNTGALAATLAPAPDVPGQVFETTAGGVVDASLGAGQGVVTLPIVAQVAGRAGNVLSGTISQLGSVVPGIASVTNTAPTAGGADVESDNALQGRVGAALSGTEGAGTVSDYQRWFLQVPGVGFVTVQPHWNGICTVRVLLTDENNNPFTDPTFIANLQALWDPNQDGDGSAAGPIGHIITIATPSSQTVDIALSLGPNGFEDGYSYDGDVGTRALRGPITNALQAYITSLPAGAPVVLYKALAAVMDVEGVANIVSLTLNGVSGDLVIPTGDVAVLNSVVLS